MGCFCHGSLAPLTLALPQLNLSADLGMPNAGPILSLSAWLSARGLPALPWTPEPGWLKLPLPQVRLSAQAVATISALATLRAQALAQFGLDLLNPAQARMFARVVATMNARLSAMATLPHFNPAAWLALARLNSAIDQVTLALKAGLLAPPAQLMLALSVPGGFPMARWQGLLGFLTPMSAMIAACAHLNVSVSETAQLSAALRVLARLQLPALAVSAQVIASLTAALQAIAGLQLSLGVSPLQIGFPQLRLMVQARLAALLPALRAQLNLSIPPGGSLLQALLSLLPNLPFVPTTLATSAVVQAALQAQALASLNWQVSAMPPALGIGLPTCALTAQLQTALNVNAVLPSPCSGGCDAAKIMRIGAAAAA